MLIDLSKVKVSSGEKRLLADKLSNWDSMHAFLVRLEKSGDLTAEFALKLLKVEATTRKRLDVAVRLLGVYHRHAREENSRRVAKALAS